MTRISNFLFHPTGIFMCISEGKRIISHYEECYSNLKNICLWPIKCLIEKKFWCSVSFCAILLYRINLALIYRSIDLNGLVKISNFYFAIINFSFSMIVSKNIIWLKVKMDIIVLVKCFKALYDLFQEKTTIILWKSTSSIILFS